MHENEHNRDVIFTLGDMTFAYDEQKNQTNIRKHGIPFTVAARVFFDYDRIEMTDDEHSDDEIRYDTIGDTSAGDVRPHMERQATGSFKRSIGMMNDILFVVYTERIRFEADGTATEIIRLISARLATNFERGVYYGKY